tara:strand:- start:1323 stop:1661 length:339 start_codon:yes stop_codon:yes gene_type:complete
MAYASGKYAYFICDTCSFRFDYKTAKTTWGQSRTCRECYEPKHPQLQPPHLTVDAESLWKPRPDVPLPQSQLGVIITTNLSAGGMTFASDPIGTDFNGFGATSGIGNVTVET